MKRTTKLSLHLPGLSDMKSMLRLACRVYEAPTARAGALLIGGLVEMLAADSAQAWLMDVTGRADGGIARPATPRLALDDDPAAALLARSMRERLPVARFARELIAEPLWELAAPNRRLGAADAIYSLHRIGDRQRSLIAIYRNSTQAQPWRERERRILMLLHGQCAWALSGLRAG